jgi:uncharacterized protein
MRIFAYALLGFVLFSAPSAAARLPVETIVVDTPNGPRQLTVEIAADSASQSLGLMHRKHLAPNAGMLFDFGKPVMCAFWMKDTILSLDMIFVRADGTISTIAPNAVPLSTKEIVSSESVRAVIEIGAGRARALGITPGNMVHASAFGNSERSR